jgi:hypothetical protein
MIIERKSKKKTAAGHAAPEKGPSTPKKGGANSISEMSEEEKEGRD